MESTYTKRRKENLLKEKENITSILKGLQNENKDVIELYLKLNK